jgi:Tfp pilus assembly protein PilF
MPTPTVSIHKSLRLFSALLLVAGCAASCRGQAQTASPSGQIAAPSGEEAAPSYKEEGLVAEKVESVYRYEADGTGEKEVFERLRLQSEAGARQFSVLSLAYASATESPQIESIVVYHPDGTKTETPASDAMAMPAPVTEQAPLYSDLKQLQIPVRGLRAGDILEYRVRVQRKNPEAPAQFWDSYGFEKNAVVLSETVTLNVPAGKYVQVWSPERKPVITDKGGRREYVWTGSQLKPTSSKAKSEAFAPPAESKPDVAWTTFHSWAEVGEWYRALAGPRAVPSDAIRAQAEEITRDARSPLDQVQALYSFVSTHIRYVGIDFGIGRYQPHLPAEVLANQYGDCKDKDTLLEALLHAKGFATAPALIGAGLALVPELPSPAFFNHAITTVSMPDGRIWMDSTPGLAPFQLLVSVLRDKQALVIPAAGSADLERTPAKTPYPFVDSLEAIATLDSDGALNGKVKISYRSDMEVAVRLFAQNLAPAQWDQGTQTLANSMGFGGTTSNSNFGRADDTSQPMQVSYDYTKKPFGDWDNLRILPLFPVITLPEAPEKQPESEIDLGAPRTETVVSRIQLPAGYSASLPVDVHAETAFAKFDLTFALEKGELTAQRTLVIRQSRLPAASWEQYRKFTKDNSLGELDWIQLSAPTRGGKGVLGSAPAERSNANAANLITEAIGLEQRNDLSDALAKLDEAKKLNPEQAILWSYYGYIAMLQNRIDDAKEDFRHELAHHPGEAFVVRFYAGILMAHGETDEAQKVLETFFDRDATDEGVDELLASIQVGKSVPDAIATLRRAMDALPDRPYLQTALGEYLIRNHQEAEAAALMKKLLAKESSDARLLNDASYWLAETNTDLPLAEEKSRKSLDILASQTADTEISEANPEAFQRTHLATASWDTLGFILLKENKLDEARDYLEAAWRNRPELVNTLHYGALQEALGNRKEAMRIYATNAPPSGQALGANVNPTYAQIGDRVKHLEAEGVSPTKADATMALQQERTFKLTLKASNSYWSAIYRVQLDANGATDAMQVSGKTPREGVVQAIKRLAFPHLVPKGFKGRILRDAVISCSSGKTECEFVLMPMDSMAAEGKTQ